MAMPSPFPNLMRTIAFLPADADALGQLAPQDLVLDLEELNVPGQLAVRGLGQKGEKRMEDGLHAHPKCLALCRLEGDCRRQSGRLKQKSDGADFCNSSANIGDASPTRT
jgi:hypothetical protein